MRAIRTNLLRIEFSTQHYLYQIEVISQTHAVKEIMHEIESQLSQIYPFALISFPLLYTRQLLDKNIIYTHLSDGSALQLRLIQCPANQSQNIASIIANLIAQKLLFLTELLHSPIFEAFFNPFEEIAYNKQRMMPGWRLGVQMCEAGAMLTVQSVRLTLSDPGSLGQQSEVLLDYDCGKFFLKQNIVRIDKEKRGVIFRNNATSRRQALYSATITPINGYPLALNIQNLIQRIKHSSEQFSSKWELKFDTRLIEVQGTYPTAGVLGFRQNIDKGLSQLITPMNFSNFINNYLNYFNSVKFDDLLRASVVYLVDNEKEERLQYVGSFRREIEKVGARMELQLVGKTVTYNNYSHLQELLNLMANQPSELVRIFIVFHNKNKEKAQLQPFQKLIQFMINSLIPFHLVEVDTNKQNNFDALAYHHLSTIYTKSRVNPWKLKNIPFMNQPMMVVAVHIEQTKQKVYSVSLVATMNLFFTKFTAVHKITSKDTIAQTVEKALIECIETFKSKHSRYPIRVFLFRSGSDAEEYLDLEKAKNEVRLRGGELTYITLYNQHGIRIFNQLDNNYISSDTVKKVQLFLYTTINKQLYYQLELETPPHRVKITPPLQNDPNFVPKVIQLISRVVTGGVGHQYGKGLGILDYPKKLNAFKQYNLANWQASLTDGILYFL